MMDLRRTRVGWIRQTFLNDWKLKFRHPKLQTVWQSLFAPTIASQPHEEVSPRDIQCFISLHAMSQTFRQWEEAENTRTSPFARWKEDDPSLLLLRQEIYEVGKRSGSRALNSPDGETVFVLGLRKKFQHERRTQRTPNHPFQRLPLSVHILVSSAIIDLGRAWMIKYIMLFITARRSSRICRDWRPTKTFTHQRNTFAMFAEYRLTRNEHWRCTWWVEDKQPISVGHSISFFIDYFPQVVHSDNKKYKCQYCGSSFKRSKALKNHLILHSGLRPYSCPFCDKVRLKYFLCNFQSMCLIPYRLSLMDRTAEATRRKLIQPNSLHLKRVERLQIPPQTFPASSSCNRRASPSTIW